MILTPDDVAADLKVPRQHVLRRLRAAQLPGFRVGRYWRIDQDAYTEWKAAQLASQDDPNRFSPRSPRAAAAQNRKARTR